MTTNDSEKQKGRPPVRADGQSGRTNYSESRTSDQPGGDRKISRSPESPLEAAWAAHEAGISPFPVKRDKRPDVANSWEPHEPTLPSQLDAMFGRVERTGLAVKCGPVSSSVPGHSLECLDVEGKAVEEGIWAEFKKLAKSAGIEVALKRIGRGYAERTPSGGLHLFAYVPEHLSKNAKLARRPATDEELVVNPADKIKTLIETKGKGGYVIVAPSLGLAGSSWKLLSGGFDSIVVVSEEEWTAITNLARSFDALPPPEHAGTPNPVIDQGRPGDAFNREGSWEEVDLEGAGWTKAGERSDGTQYWCRPGKAVGISATLDHASHDMLHVFSSSTVFPEADQSYKKFSAFTYLHFDGDFAAAAKKLAEMGYSGENDEESDIAKAGYQAYVRKLGDRWALDRIEEESGLEPLRPLTLADLRERSVGFEWQIKGLMYDSTYGPVGGEGKTLKSYVMSFVTVGLAAGKSVFDHFDVPKALPVVSFIGEGGEGAYLDRMERIAERYGVDVDNLPIINIFDVAQIGSKRFNEAVERALSNGAPGLVTIDPMYAYQGGDVQASNIYERGAFLNRLYTPFKEAKTSLYVGDHFNQNGNGFGLQRLSQAGMKEWADSWILLRHAQPADPAKGKFELQMQVGSRRWGETNWALSLDIGPFDYDTGHHAGDIDFTLEPMAAEDVPSSASKSTDKRALIVAAILNVTRDKSFELSRTEICDEVGCKGGKYELFTSAFKSLVGTFLTSELVERVNDAGRKRSVEVWGHKGDSAE